MAENFLGELFKNVGSDIRKSRENKLDPLELMLKHAQLERLRQEDQVQAEAMRSAITKQGYLVRKSAQELYKETILNY